MRFSEPHVTCWRELLLMLLMTAVLMADVFVFDSFSADPGPARPRSEATAAR
jgi:hypothetical protein